MRALITNITSKRDSPGVFAPSCIAHGMCILSLSVYYLHSSINVKIVILTCVWKFDLMLIGRSNRGKWASCCTMDVASTLVYWRSHTTWYIRSVEEGWFCDQLCYHWTMWLECYGMQYKVSALDVKCVQHHTHTSTVVALIIVQCYNAKGLMVMILNCSCTF